MQKKGSGDIKAKTNSQKISIFLDTAPDSGMQNKWARCECGVSREKESSFVADAERDKPDG